MISVSNNVTVERCYVGMKVLYLSCRDESLKVIEGKVVDIESPEDSRYPIIVSFGNCDYPVTFSADGRYSNSDDFPTLFYGPMSIAGQVPPPRVKGEETCSTATAAQIFGTVESVLRTSYIQNGHYQWIIPKEIKPEVLAWPLDELRKWQAYQKNREKIRISREHTERLARNEMLLQERTDRGNEVAPWLLMEVDNAPDEC